MRTVLITISIAISIILTYSMYLFANNFVHLVDSALDRLFYIRFGYWSLQHLVFALSVGTAPLISLIPWIVLGNRNALSLVVYNLLSAVLISSFVVATAFWLIVISPNKGIFNTIKQPHEDFWNFVLIGSDLLVILIFTFYSIGTRKEYKLKALYNDKQSQIDQ